jgi:hypothetical protein
MNAVTHTVRALADSLPFRAAVCLLAFALVQVDRLFGGPRFAVWWANDLVNIWSFLLPAFSFGYMRRCLPGWRRSVALTVIAPITGLSFAAFLLSLLFFLMGLGVSGPSYSKSKAHVGRSTIRGYLSSPGAFSSFNLSVIEERPIIPGLVWVRELDYQHSTNQFRVEVLDRNHIRLTYPSHSMNDPKPVQVVVRIGG